HVRAAMRNPNEDDSPGFPLFQLLPERRLLGERRAQQETTRAVRQDVHRLGYFAQALLDRAGEPARLVPEGKPPVIGERHDVVTDAECCDEIVVVDVDERLGRDTWLVDVKLTDAAERELIGPDPDRLPPYVEQRPGKGRHHEHHWP